MEICIKLEDVENCIKNLNSNKKFLFIKNNLFSIDNIKTLKAPMEKNSLYKNTEFEFSYDDSCKNEIIKITYMHEDYSCITFVKNCQLISENERNQIIDHAFEIEKEKNKNNSHFGISLNQDDVDNIFYNEVLIYISSKINENDKSNLKDDFISKYELFKEKKQEATKKTIDAINNLYKQLIEIKLSGN